MKHRRAAMILTLILLLTLMVLPAGCGPMPALADGEEIRMVDRSKRQDPESSSGRETSPADKADPSPEAETAAADIYVHVCGCVRKPGLYRLPAGSRVLAAVEAAGGFTGEADQTAWNLAAVLEDGRQVYIPDKKEAGEKAAGSWPDSGAGGQEADASPSSSGKVNINTATQQELMVLPGIGESRAADIIAYREEKGSFKTTDEIRNVSGIGDGIYNKLKDQITVD